ncbi:hypothetical protein ACPCAJ_02120 [Streptomyces griseoincarnatus]
MARIQILPLPEGASDERPPFALVIDEYLPRRYAIGPDQLAPVDEFAGVAEKIGARAVLVFEETVQIPANDTSAYVTPVATVHLSGDDLLPERVKDEIAKLTARTGPEGLK